MDIAALDVSREELVEHLRALRRFSRGVVKAYVTLVCHSPACAVQDVRISFMERH
jgi:hypothetical protein